MNYHIETIYMPEVLEATRRNEERHLVREGMELWRAKKEQLRSQKLRDQCELRRMLVNYWPWGKPGGGAPCASALRKRNVPLEEPYEQSSSLPPTFQQLPKALGTKSMISRPYSDKVYNGSVSHQLMRMNEKKLQAQSTQNTPMDISHPVYEINSLKTLNAFGRKYTNDLTEQIRRKQERAREEYRREKESCHRHFATWQKLWSKPNRNTLIDHSFRRKNLHDILYRMPLTLSDAVCSDY